jgi:RHS repeat-associated protein
VSDWAGGKAALAYDDAQRLISISRSNGVTTQYSYDKDGRISAINESAGGQSIASIALQRDPAGQVTSAARNLPQAPAPAPGVLGLNYDAASQISGATYDALGRITKDAFRSYTWNLAEELTGYSGVDGSASFGYDGLGLRTSATAPDGTTQNYVLNYALGLPSIATVQSGGADQRYYVHLPGGALLWAVEAADNSHHFYSFDETGSTTLLTDDAGHVIDSYGVTPYGESVTTNGNTPNPFTWQGQWGLMQEGSTGLYYDRARYYDSTPARFLSRDPKPSVLSPYQYALGNPESYVDLDGTAPQQYLGLLDDSLLNRPLDESSFIPGAADPEKFRENKQRFYDELLNEAVTGSFAAGFTGSLDVVSGITSPGQRSSALVLAQPGTVARDLSSPFTRSVVLSQLINELTNVPGVTGSPSVAPNENLSTGPSAPPSAASRQNLSDFTLLQVIQKSTPRLLEAFCTGSHLRTGKRIPDSQRVDTQRVDSVGYLGIQLKKLPMESVGLAPGLGTPTESLSLAFAAVDFTYRSPAPDSGACK